MVKGTNYGGQWDSWYGPSGSRNATAYSYFEVEHSLAGEALKKANFMPSSDSVR